MRYSASKGVFHDRFVTLIVTLTGGLVVAGLLRFNYSARGYEYYLVGNLIGILFIPLLTIFFVFREDPSKFGFQLGESRHVWLATTVMLVGMVAILIPISSRQDFQTYYPIFRQFESFYDGDYFNRSDTVALIYGWASYGLYLFCWEFFFRGYLLFGLARTIKWPAIIIQSIAFGILHWGKVPIEVASSFVAGFILGAVALRAKSFLPCFVLHWAVSIALDVLVLVRGSV